MPMDSSSRSILRIRVHPTGGVPVSIATIADFGPLRIDEKNSTDKITIYIPTKHILDNRDFEKIMNLTAIQFLSRQGAELVMKREYRVRIKSKENRVKYSLITSFKVCEISNKIVEFRWKPTTKGDGPKTCQLGPNESSAEKSYRDFGNIFDEQPNFPNEDDENDVPI